MRRILAVLLVLWTVPAFAATRTVGSGKTHATIQACAAVAVAGDTCEVYAGTYVEATITPANSGSAGSPIIFLAHTGDTVTVVGVFVVTNRAYITVDGFTFTGGWAIRAEDGADKTTNHITVKNNHVVWPSRTTTAPTFRAYGDYFLIENNYVDQAGSDFTNIGGDYLVVRNNTFRNAVQNTAGGGEPHIDFFQVIGAGLLPTGQHALFEGNVFNGCVDNTYNCHLFLHRTGSGPVGRYLIVRFNYAVSLDGSGISFGASVADGDAIERAYAYQNTLATGYLGVTNGDCVTFVGVTTGAAKNNICYNSISTTRVGFYDASSTGITYNGNLTYTTGYAGEWGTPYATEATYAALKNHNPQFANLPTDGTLGASSPARAAGVALTTVAVADTGSGTSLVLTDAGYFQAGWAGVGADWVRVGDTATAEIASIDYATNTVTLASGISRSDGDSVYLYKRSDGQIVLNAGAPDVGAYAYGFTPDAPTSLAVSSTSSAVTLSWTHSGTNATQFETQVDGAIPRNVGLPTPSVTTYSTTLPGLTAGAHTVIVRACNGTLCTDSASIVIVKM